MSKKVVWHSKAVRGPVTHHEPGVSARSAAGTEPRWLWVPGPLTDEPPQIAQTNYPDRCGPDMDPGITGSGGFGHGWATDDLGQHGQSMGWAQAPAQPTGLTSAAGPCNSGLGRGSGNPWARTKMTRGQKKAKKRRQGAEMKHAWAQVVAERGESIAASVLFPRYFAHWHACEQYRSCTRWFMPYCPDTNTCHSLKGL